MEKERLLRRALLGNALFSGMSGAVFLMFSGGLAAWLGLPAVWPLWAVGVGLALFAADLLHQATRRRLSLFRAVLGCGSDLAWVIASAALLLGWPHLLSGGGQAAVVAVAMVVATFAGLQSQGIARLRRAEA